MTLYLYQLARGVEIDSTKTVAQLSGHNHITVATVNQLYLFMGRELEMLDEVPAGNVLGKQAGCPVLIDTGKSGIMK